MSRQAWKQRAEGERQFGATTKWTRRDFAILGVCFLACLACLLLGASVIHREHRALSTHPLPGVFTHLVAPAPQPILLVNHKHKSCYLPSLAALAP